MLPYLIKINIEPSIYTRAIIGTTSSVNLAILSIPPIKIRAATIANITPTTIGLNPKAAFNAPEIELD